MSLVDFLLAALAVWALRDIACSTSDTADALDRIRELIEDE